MMSNLLQRLLIVVSAVAPLCVSLECPAQTTSAASTGTSADATPVYQPPLRGTTAGGRIGGGSRGTGEQAITVSVLAPEHPGRTLSGQPRLYWFLSDRVDIPIEVTLVDKHSSDPLLALTISPPVERGIHALDLERQGVRLESDVRYEWFVALVPDPDQRSRDIVAGAEIERVTPPAGLADKLAAAGRDGGPVVYAQAGIWYDAMDAVSMQIARRPADPVYREHRAALLDQVGLEHVAAYDRSLEP
jgi:Domain of Unknown Function (DUF928)